MYVEKESTLKGIQTCNFQIKYIFNDFSPRIFEQTSYCSVEHKIEFVYLLFGAGVPNITQYGNLTRMKFCLSVTQTLDILLYKLNIYTQFVNLSNNNHLYKQPAENLYKNLYETILM